jgi:hypothetical protein
MRPVSDAFLLNLAEVSATLVGLFLVGVFFYAETGFRRLARNRELVERYFRSGTRISLIIFAFPIGLSLTLVILTPVWNTALFAVLSLILVAANVDSAARIWPMARTTRSTVLLVNEVIGTVGVAIVVALPWILGGLHPTREHLTWSILLAFVVGSLSVGALMLSVVDFGSSERDEREPRDDS